MGGLYLSWLRSGIKAETIAQLPMLAAAAAHDAIARIGVSDIRIKWPNDILVGGRKLAGVLVFARHGDTTWVTVGLGVNVETTPVLEESSGMPATSLAEILGEGETEVATGHHTERSNRAFTASDIRFTTQGNALYAICLAWPGKEATIRSLGTGSPVEAGRIAGVTMLGSGEDLAWSQDETGLKVKTPAEPPCQHACTFRVALKDAR